MTEPRQSLPINIFNPSSESLSSGRSLTGGIQSQDTGNKSFLRELSRATDQATSKREMRTNNNKKDSEASTKPEPTRSVNSEKRASRPEVENSRSNSSSTSTQHSQVPDEGSQTESDKSVQNSRGTNPSKSTQGADGLERVTDAKPETHTGDADASESGNETGAAPTPVADVDALLVEIVSGGEPVIEGLTVTLDAPSTSPQNDTSDVLEGNKVVRVDEAVTTLGSMTTLSSIGVNSIAVSDVKSPEGELSSDEQLLSARLANRQALRTGKISLPEQPGTAPLAARSSSLPADVNAHTELADHTGRRAGAGVTPPQLLANTQLRRNTLTGFEGTPAGMKVLAVNKTADVVNIDESGGELLSNLLSSKAQAEGNVKQRLLQAEVKASVDLTAKLSTKKIQQQMVQANLLQTKQLNLQQLQIPLAGIQAGGVESGSSGTQSADNMFHSMPGGIVTAPVQQRTDPGNMQTINAPLNMSILQNDADKAMAGNIRWMVGEGVKNAVVNVTPSGMGPISVTIGMERDQMNISIVALQGSTREALDSMLPRLREQLGAQGHDSVKVDISDGRGEQSDRGYGQQFSGEEHGPDNNTHWSVSDIEDETAVSSGATNNGSTSVGPQGAQSVNLDVLSGSRYDVYV